MIKNSLNISGFTQKREKKIQKTQRLKVWQKYSPIKKHNKWKTPHVNK
jgi:hypothetical protein